MGEVSRHGSNTSRKGGVGSTLQSLVPGFIRNRRHDEVVIDNTSDNTSAKDVNGSVRRINSTYSLSSSNIDNGDVTSAACENYADEEYLKKLETPLPLRSTIMSSFVGVFVAVGGFLYGYDTGLINTLTDMKYVKSHIAPDHVQFTAEQTAILVSFLSLGTFFGALAAPWISDRYGRRPTIIFSTAIIFALGNSLQVGANHLPLLVAGRVISGISIGITSAVVPLYQAEAAQKNLRGAIISTYQFAITIGLLVSCAVGQGTRSKDGPSSYRIPIGLQYIWSTFLAVGMYFLPESPRYYIITDEINKAARALSFLRGIPIEDPRLLEELVEIKATYDYESSFGKATFLDCFRSSEVRPKQVLRMITGMGIQIMQQFSGINFIFYYGVNFFSYTGVKNNYMVSFITYAVNVVFNVPGMFFVEYFGRRKVLLGGAVLMTISNYIVAIVGLTVDDEKSGKVAIAFICVFVASFASTWGGIVWVVSAELYPLGVRSKCTAICVAVNWLINFVCAFMTPYISDNNSSSPGSSSKVFFIWGSLNALSIAVVYFTVYETRGLTLEQIDELYRKSPTCFTSTSWNKKIRERPINYNPNAATHMLHNIEALNSAQNTTAITTGVDIPMHDMASVAVKKPAFIERDADVNMTDISTDVICESIIPGKLPNVASVGIPDISNNYVDLGNGLGLNTYNRGPPSILTDSSDEDDGVDNTENDLGSSSYKSNEESLRKDNINSYMANLLDSASNTSGGTNFSTYHSENSETPLYSTFINQMRNHPRSNTSASDATNNDWNQYLAQQSDASSRGSSTHPNNNSEP